MPLYSVDFDKQMALSVCAACGDVAATRFSALQRSRTLRALRFPRCAACGASLSILATSDETPAMWRDSPHVEQRAVVNAVFAAIEGDEFFERERPSEIVAGTGVVRVRVPAGCWHASDWNARVAVDREGQSFPVWFERRPSAAAERARRRLELGGFSQEELT